MHRLKVMLALILLAFCGVPLASAAGVGTFSIEQTTAGVGVGQFGIATLYMDNTWQPPADSVTLAISWDPAVLQYVSTDWKVGNSVAATPAGTSELTFSFADYTNKYPAGRVPIAAINFKGLAAGQTTLGIRVDSVRSHVGISETDFTELTPSAIANPGIFTVGQGGGTVTTVTTVPTLTTLPTLTSGPTVTGTVTGGVTTPITLPTTLPTTGITTGITTGATGAPFIPVQGSTGDNEDYTGVVTRTPTVTATTTATATATATVTGTTTVTGTATAGTGNGTVTTTATPVGNLTTGTTAATATRTAIATTPAGTTTARTTVPVNTTATRAGADVLPLAAAGLVALALIAARRR